MWWLLLLLLFGIAPLFFALGASLFVSVLPVVAAVPAPLPAVTPLRVTTATSTPTSVPTATNTPIIRLTSTPSPTGTPFVRPTATSTPTLRVTSTPTPTMSATATITPTPCPTLAGATVRGSVNPDNSVNVVWTSRGGCAPFTGTVAARYRGERLFYATHSIKEPNGRLVDRPPLRCEGLHSVDYTLTLRDAAGQAVSATTTVSITWIC